MELEKKTEKIWHGSFEVAVFIKGFLGLLELVSGVLLVLISADRLQHIFNVLMSKDLPWNLDAFFVYFSHQYIDHIRASTKNIAGVYVISRGVINLFLIIGLVLKKAQAYLVAMGVMASFMLYQIFRFFIHPSWLLGALTTFDILFIILLYHEYRHLTLNQKTDKNI